jgi:mRNA-degrading endonuclease RelE of RelBE toxin-antitoxin system
LDRRFLRLPPNERARILAKIKGVGLHLRDYPHSRMEGWPTNRLRVGDDRVIYRFNLERHELELVTDGQRGDIYRDLQA